jgi:hypothetical protein
LRRDFSVAPQSNFAPPQFLDLLAGGRFSARQAEVAFFREFDKRFGIFPQKQSFRDQTLRRLLD